MFVKNYFSYFLHSTKLTNNGTFGKFIFSVKSHSIGFISFIRLIFTHKFPRFLNVLLVKRSSLECFLTIILAKADTNARKQHKAHCAKRWRGSLF